MKALTVKNPFATLIAMGIKDIENRTWRTNYRGRLLIHAASQEVPLQSFDKLLTPEQRHIVEQELFGLNFLQGNSEILCSVDLVDCVQNHPSLWAERSKPREKPIWNWVLRDLQPEPDYHGKKIKGALSIWDITNQGLIVKNHDR